MFYHIMLYSVANQSISLTLCLLLEKAHDKKVLYLPAQWWAHNGYPVNDRSTIIHPRLKAEMCSSSLTLPFCLIFSCFSSSSDSSSRMDLFVYPSLCLLCLHTGPGHHSLSLTILQLYPHWSLHFHFYSFQTILCTAANSFPCVK